MRLLQSMHSNSPQKFYDLLLFQNVEIQLSPRCKTAWFELSIIIFKHFNINKATFMYVVFTARLFLRRKEILDGSQRKTCPASMTLTFDLCEWNFQTALLLINENNRAKSSWNPSIHRSSRLDQSGEREDRHTHTKWRCDNHVSLAASELDKSE